MAPNLQFSVSRGVDLLHSSRKAHPTRNPQHGFSLLEMLVVLMMASVLSNIAIGNLKELNDPLQNGSAQLAAFLKQVRTKAISQTVAYRVTASGSNRLVTRFANNCAATTTSSDPLLNLTLPNGTSLTSTSFDFCFSSRGLTDQNVILGIHDNQGTKNIEVMLGGGVRVS